MTMHCPVCGTLVVKDQTPDISVRFRGSNIYRCSQHGEFKIEWLGS
jgi:NAD-dependent DNA ligase C4 zinc finger domain